MSEKERIMHSPNSFAGINDWKIISTRKRKILGKIIGTLFVYLVVGLIFSGLIDTVDAANFSIGDTVEVTTNLNVRTGAGTGYSEITDSDYLAYAPTGTIGKILSGPSSANGYVWWEVDFGSGLYSGWSTEDGFKQAEKITINNWIIEVTAHRSPESVDVYLRANDSKESGGIIEVPKSPYIRGLSSIVLIKRGKEQALGFVAGKLSSPGNHLIVVEVKIHNTEKASRSLRIGDINLINTDGQNLPGLPPRGEYGS